MNQKQRRDLWYKGYKTGAEQTTKMLFAAVAVAAHREFGFGAVRCKKLLNEAYQMTIEFLSSPEAIGAAWQEVGLEINFEEPFDPVEEIDGSKQTTGR